MQRKACRPRRIPYLAALAALAALTLAQSPDYKVDTKFASKPQVEELFQRIDARNDQWVGERDYEDIHQQLELWAAGLKKGEKTFPRLDTLAPRFSRLDVVQLKIVASGRDVESAPEASIRIRVELAGESRTGGPLSLQGHWETVWTHVQTAWKLDRIAPSTLREIKAGPLRFVDVTQQAFGANPSLSRQLSKSVDHRRGLLDEAAGVDVYGHNGVAVGDCDGDGWEDLYFAQPSGLPNRLFHNNGNGTFTDVSAASGLDILDDTRSALFADIDNDGDQDLIVITATRPILFRNDGHGKFSMDAASGLDIPKDQAGSLTSAVMADFDRDGWLDLYICSYDFWKPGKTYNAPTPYYDAVNGPPNFLFRNLGGKRFENVTARAGLMANNNRYSFAAAWGDYNNDGWPDLIVANDFGRKNLYRNEGDGTFEDVAEAAGVADLGAGMSAAWGDSNNDGLLDLYTGNMWSSAGQRITGNRQFLSVAPAGPVRQAFQRQARGNSLFMNGAQDGFVERSAEAGVEMGRWAWSSDFADLDNDGLLDLYVTNGYISGPDLRDL